MAKKTKTGAAPKRPLTRRSEPQARKGASPTPSTKEDFAVPSSDDGSFAIVGVGASAGGLEAFTSLLRSLPPNPRLAIVFVQHLAPQHESALTVLLSSQSTLSVVEVTEGMKVEPNHVYVIPPNSQLVINDQQLHVNPRPTDRTRYNPIDAFFSSLARAAGQRSIAVVLSGTASVGSRALRAVKSPGGMALARTPETAKYDGMPRAAIATGIIDLVLPPDEMGPKLAELANFSQVSDLDGSEPEADLTDEQLQEVFA